MKAIEMYHYSLLNNTTIFIICLCICLILNFYLFGFTGAASEKELVSFSIPFGCYEDNERGKERKL